MVRNAIFASILVGLVSASDGDLDSSVAILTDQNFGEALKQMEAEPEKIWLVEFYAPWCAHCKKLAPIYEEAAKEVQNFRFAKIDATANKASATKYEIKGYPSIKWVRDGHFRPYRNGHSVQGFAGLATKLYAPPVTEINDVATYNKLNEDHAVWFLLGYSDASEDVLKVMEAYKEVARKYQDELHFGVTYSKEVLSLIKKGKKVAEQGVKKPFIAKMHANGEEAPGMFDIKFEDFIAMEKDDRADKLSVWTYDQKMPLVTDLSGMTFYDASHSGRMLCAAVTGSDEDKKKFKEGFLQLARPTSSLSQEVQSKFYFGVMDGTEDRVDKFLSQYGIDVKELPKVVVFELNKKDDEKYFNEETDSLDGVAALLEGITGGSITPQYEGFWGLPEKIWRQLKAILFFIPMHHLDVLPRYTFVSIFGVLIVGGLLKVVCMDMEDDEEESEGYKDFHRKLREQKAAETGEDSKED
jgi:protein disulfide-isomerase A1